MIEDKMRKWFSHEATSIEDSSHPPETPDAEK